MSQRVFRRIPSLLALAVSIAASGCGSDGPACDLTNPVCSAGGTGQVAAIAISSPGDSVIVTGSTVQLVGVTADARGVVISAVVNWTSSDRAVAEVTSSGLVSAGAPGPVTITASAGTASATYAMWVVDARLAEVESVLADPTLTSEAAALSAGTEAQARRGASGL